MTRAIDGMIGKVFGNLTVKNLMGNQTFVMQNASSVATLLLTSEALVAEKPKEEKAAPGPPGGEDMY